MVAEGSLPAVTLVLGGARSGKSRFAEQCIASMAPPFFYVATAEPRDVEMTERIHQHQMRRGADWQTIEEPLALRETLERLNKTGAVILVDCLTLWLSNLMLAGRDIEQSIASLCVTLCGMKGHVVLVSNEVGQGIVPDNDMARQFRDFAGYMHQDIAAVAQSVVMVIAGLPLTLKPSEGK
jgi:adenosylcobinamide kinase / adenosylcobinamide-phosphate guanylyltransferase